MTDPRTVTISLPPELARRVDEIAEAEGRSRSELFREAVRQYLDRRQRLDVLYSFGEDYATKTGVTEAGVIEAVRAERRRQRPTS